MLDISVPKQKEEKKSFNFFRLGVIVVLGVYFLWVALNPSEWQFLDGVNLLIHEAGHFIFVFLGEFITAAGGTILQITTPALFVAYFHIKGQYFSTAVVMFWLGQSFLNVSVYARDAVAMNLPLLGGDSSGHDWNYLLSQLNLLPHTELVANLIRGIGIAIIIAAIIMGVISSRRLKRIN